jgi:galactose oxidase-like protein
VLVLGGDVGAIQPTAAAEIFDPDTDEFTAIGNMTTPRMLHFAVLLGDGTVLIGGGQDDTGEVLASAELFDPATGNFLPVEDMPLPGEEQAAAAATR